MSLSPEYHSCGLHEHHSMRMLSTPACCGSTSSGVFRIYLYAAVQKERDEKQHKVADSALIVKLLLDAEQHKSARHCTIAAGEAALAEGAMKRA